MVDYTYPDKFVWVLFRLETGFMSRRIISTLTTMFIALVMAILVWVAAIQEENPITIEMYPQEIPLSVTPPAEGILLPQTGKVPRGVQVQLKASQSSWQQLSQAKFSAWIDLSPYSVGLVEVPVQTRVADEQVVIEEVFPAMISVQLEPLATKEMPVSIRLIGDPPSGFSYKLPREPLSVTLKGPSTAINEVERVEAQVLMTNVRETVEREIRPLPKNGSNETVSTIQVEPMRPTITISLEQKFGYNTVGIKAKVVGEPAPGYYINSISTSPAEIVLRGLDEAPSSIETAEIDISQITGDIVKRVPLNIPSGFSVEIGQGETPEDSRSILVTVEIAAINSSLSREQIVSVQGVDSSLTWVLDPETVELLLRGPVPLFENLNDENVAVIVDLFGLGPGVYRLPPTIIKPEGLEIGSIIPDTIQVTITDNTPPPLITPTSTISTSTTDTLDETVSLTNTTTITE